jgi:hypothetical protein
MNVINTMSDPLGLDDLTEEVTNTISTIIASAQLQPSSIMSVSQVQIQRLNAVLLQQLVDKLKAEVAPPTTTTTMAPTTTIPHVCPTTTFAPITTMAPPIAALEQNIIQMLLPKPTTVETPVFLKIVSILFPKLKIP